MNHITDEMIDDCISSFQVGTDFDFHDYRKELTARYPDDYARELDSAGGERVFEKVHPQIARKLAQNRRLEKLPDRESENIRGANTPNSVWRRVS